jgi:hypothetical protein
MTDISRCAWNNKKMPAIKPLKNQAASVRKHDFKTLALRAQALAVLLAVTSAGAAQAQFYPFSYSPLTGSSSIFWPMRVLLSPASLFWRGGYGYNAPYYLANTLTYNAAYAAGAGLTSASRKHYWNPANGINAPAVDQIAPARWYNPASAAPAAALSNPSIPDNTGNNQSLPADGSGSEFMPVPAGLAAGTAPPLSTAPDYRLPNTQSQPAAANTGESVNSNNTTEAPAGSSNPFAQAFVDHVNSKFGSDIGRALADRQTRSYAQALGIVGQGAKNLEIPTERVELARRILQDKGEDSLTKVNTIRLLIKY